jgi:hypothetical protein
MLDLWQESPLVHRLTTPHGHRWGELISWSGGSNWLFGDRSIHRLWKIERLFDRAPSLSRAGFGMDWEHIIIGRRREHLQILIWARVLYRLWWLNQPHGGLDGNGMHASIRSDVRWSVAHVSARGGGGSEGHGREAAVFLQSPVVDMPAAAWCWWAALLEKLHRSLPRWYHIKIISRTKACATRARYVGAIISAASSAHEVSTNLVVRIFTKEPFVCGVAVWVVGLWDGMTIQRTNIEQISWLASPSIHKLI